jgi:hypothetical protein
MVMKLWDYLNKEHGLILLESEINDILELARQEIELPDDIEKSDRAADYINDNGAYGDKFDAFKDGFDAALAKVRNPYPKSIRFQEDPDEFFKK